MALDDDNAAVAHFRQTLRALLFFDNFNFFVPYIAKAMLVTKKIEIIKKQLSALRARSVLTT
ncbi:hypothetical protein Dip510_001983 [Elusimicrobium posterum]|uniref:hypothetical protein n=1 Tax=Elusimicrobium posterum TaxID=3116653 RepID=UPI003C72AE22